MKKCKRREPYNIPSITEYLAEQVLSGAMTLEDAAGELQLAGWMNYIDVERAKRLLFPEG